MDASGCQWMLEDASGPVVKEPVMPMPVAALVLFLCISIFYFCILHTSSERLPDYYNSYSCAVCAMTATDCH